MKRYILLLISALLLSFNVTADNYSDAIGKFKKAPETDPFFNQAYGYAVFPTVGKGGFGVGFKLSIKFPIYPTLQAPTWPELTAYSGIMGFEISAGVKGGGKCVGKVGNIFDLF